MAVGSFSAGLSGLAANAQALTVIGNNLANINTLGFKASQVAFQDLVSQNLGGSGLNPAQGGLGVSIGGVSPIFSQGAIETSRMGTHVAIQGNGFYMVEGPEGLSYTRAGNFSFNAEGALVTPEGHFVQGYTQTDPLTGELITSGSTSQITVPPGVLREPVATTTMQTVTNLDANADDGETFSVAIQIYDALGGAHDTTMTYTKVAGAPSWTYAWTVDGGDTAGGVVGTPVSLGTGTVTFGPTGALTAPVADVVMAATPAWANGAGPQIVTWDILRGTTAVPSLTGYAAKSSTTSIAQNGAAAGMVTNVNVNSEGKILAMSAAGTSVLIGQLALVNFNNPQGLIKLGSNRYGPGESAGLPNIGVAGTGGRGTVVGAALEQSNVDMAQEFTQMILMQRGYQANSRTITVSDQLLQETLNLKN
jgi:flagellar hook protein FlgE